MFNFGGLWSKLLNGMMRMTSSDISTMELQKAKLKPLVRDFDGFCKLMKWMNHYTDSPTFWPLGTSIFDNVRWESKNGLHRQNTATV